ncbi:hypothetical protein, partial [Actinomadura sp. CNU-125]|uniref:hypothetical protein n=1 Tax=Actinomadura sp. CNU-125 TaxID=1904961 RepID=UPI000A750658
RRRPAAVAAAIVLLTGGDGWSRTRSTTTRADAPPAARPRPGRAAAVDGPSSTGPSPDRPSPTPSETSDGPLPAGFPGTWTGTVTQRGGITIGDATTTVTIELDDDGEGTADYTGWGCRMSLSLTDAGASRAEFREQIEDATGVTGVCMAGTLTLERVSGGLEYRASGAGTGDTEGVLRAA